MKKTLPIIFIVLVYSFFACNPETEQGNGQSKTGIDSLNLEHDFDKASKIFYNLPSPHEIANLLLSDTAVQFREELLNPVSNYERYNTERSMALNLGIYSTDMSFASLFEQNQVVMHYIAVTKKLADKLGVTDVLGEDNIKLLSDQIENRDELMDLISDIFRRSDTFLKQNNRAETASLIVLGGWIEGMYLAIEIANQKIDNATVIERVIEQELSLLAMIELLESYENNQHIASILPSIKELKVIYHDVQFTAPDEDVPINPQVAINHKEFDKLHQKIVEIRNSYIK